MKKILRIPNENLTSLVGIVPQGTTRIYCDNNELTSLEGLPESIKYIDAHNNKLTSLKGLPKGVQKIHCSNNQLTSLEGLPDSVVSLNYKSNPIWFKHLTEGKIPLNKVNGIGKIIKYIK